MPETNEIANTDRRSPTSPAMSFCIITAGKRAELLERVIHSIERQQIPECEIIVVGRHLEQPGIVYIPGEEHADAGRLGAMRNLGVASTRYENVVLLDDDIVLATDWYRNFCEYGREFDILTSQVRLPDGGRYWDRSTSGGPLGHRILTEDEDDDHVYMTGGGGWVMKQNVARAVHWDECRGFYEFEDVDFAQRCRERGFRISHNHRSVVFHADPHGTTVGRAVFRRTDGRTHAWINDAARGLTAQELGRQIGSHLRANRIAEAADGLRFGQQRFPQFPEFARTWGRLEDLHGGPLPDARWSSTDDREYAEAMAQCSGSVARAPTTDESAAPPQSLGRSIPRISAPSFGINVFGFLSGNLGLGVAARAYIQLLLDSGVPVQPVEIEVCGGRAQHDLSLADRACTLGDATPHPVNLFVINPPDLAAIVQGQPRAIQLEGRVNICLPFWELTKVPPQWRQILECLDAVAAASQFIRYVMLASLSGPFVPYWPQPIYLPENTVPDRARWGIPRDSVMFVSAFEMASDTNRKNPLGAIEAFNRAFTQQDDAYLVVKVNNARAFPSEGPYRQLREYVARNPKILLLDEVLPYRDVLSLYASADAFLSLHRAEGLGLCLLEAMSLGRPVIATGWSGNMDFMTDQNSCLVGYSLVPVQASTQAAYSVEKIGTEARWAEPNLDHAVAWLRRLAEDPALRGRIGKQAAADVAARQARMSAAELEAAVETVLTLRRRGPA